MGQMTRAALVSEGLLLAQRPADDYPTQVTNWLQRWLDSVAASWPWPLLQREATGLVVSAGSLTVGNAQGGVTPKILKVLDNCWMYDATRTFLQRVRIKPQLNRPDDRLPPNGAVGPPAEMRIFQTTFGVWTLHFNPARPNLRHARAAADLHRVGSGARHKPTGSIDMQAFERAQIHTSA
jgi:hypothetical protein